MWRSWGVLLCFCCLPYWPAIEFWVIWAVRSLWIHNRFSQGCGWSDMCLGCFVEQNAGKSHIAIRGVSSLSSSSLSLLLLAKASAKDNITMLLTGLSYRSSSSNAELGLHIIRGPQEQMHFFQITPGPNLSSLIHWDSSHYVPSKAWLKNMTISLPAVPSKFTFFIH